MNTIDRDLARQGSLAAGRPGTGRGNGGACLRAGGLR